MIDQDKIYQRLSEAMEPAAARKLAEVLATLYDDLRQTVTKAEFGELRDIVRELAEAQKRTEARVEELAEAQKRTEARVEELAEAQKRTEQALARLAATVEGMQSEIVSIKKELGGLSNTIGYTLENAAYRSLPRLLLNDHGLKVHGRLARGYLTDDRGRTLEMNIIGQGSVGTGDEVQILGESKSQLSKNEIDRFLREGIESFRKTYPRVFPIIVAHMISRPDVAEYAKAQGVALYLSYDFEE